MQELDRQRGYQNEAQAALTKALGGQDSGARTAAFNDAVADRNATAASVAPAPAGFSPVSPNAPIVVKNAADEGLRGASNDSAARAAALARVFAYGDVNQTTDISANRSGQKIGDLTNIAGVSNSLNRLEQDVNARNAQKGPSILANGLNSIADMGLFLALSGQLGAPGAKKSPGLTAPNNSAFASQAGGFG